MIQRQHIGTQIGDFFRSKSLLSGIITANIAIWLFALLFGIIDYLFCLTGGVAKNVWNDWFSLSSSPQELLYRPWTIVTYMFLHANFWHLLWNMLLLYAAGVMCCQYLGIRRFGWIYFLSGIFGGLLYMLSYNIFPVFIGTRGMLVGASAGVLGVFVAVATYIPNQEVALWPFRQIPIKMKWLALVVVVLDMLSVSGGNSGGHIAHLGGALFGFLFVWISRQSKDSKSWLGKWQQTWKSKANAKAREKQSRADARTRAKSDEAYNRQRAADQKKVDAILDKISKSGYESLSKEERTFLFNYKK